MVRRSLAARERESLCDLALELGVHGRHHLHNVAFQGSRTNVARLRELGHYLGGWTRG
jgi:hypothetical protein